MPLMAFEINFHACPSANRKMEGQDIRSEPMGASKIDFKWHQRHSVNLAVKASKTLKYLLDDTGNTFKSSRS